MERSVCAHALASEGSIKTHSSNGTYCAVMDQCVYLTCAHPNDRITNKGCGKFKVVNKHTIDARPEEVSTGYSLGCVHWVMLTKESWESLTGALPPVPLHHSLFASVLTHRPTHSPVTLIFEFMADEMRAMKIQNTGEMENRNDSTQVPHTHTVHSTHIF